MICLGIDPGRHGAMALLRSGSSSPLVLGAWRVDAEALPAYHDAALQVLLSVQRLCGSERPVVWIEDVPPFGSAKTAIGLARRQGLLLGALYALGFRLVCMPKPTEWTAEYRKAIRTGKSKAVSKGGDGGKHRIDEAHSLLDWGQQRAETVDVAEAALIAGAGLISRGEWKLDHLPEVGKKVRADHLRDGAEMMPAKKTRKKATAEESSVVRKRGRKG